MLYELSYASFISEVLFVRSGLCYRTRIVCDLCILPECAASFIEAEFQHQWKVGGQLLPWYLGSSEDVNIMFCFLNLCQGMRRFISIDAI